MRCASSSFDAWPRSSDLVLGIIRRCNTRSRFTTRHRDTHCRCSNSYTPHPAAPKPAMVIKCVCGAIPKETIQPTTSSKTRVGCEGSPSNMKRFCRPSWKHLVANPNALKPRTFARRDMLRVYL